MTPARLIIILQLFVFSVPARAQRVPAAGSGSFGQNNYRDASVIRPSRSFSVLQKELASKNNFQTIRQAGSQNEISEMHIAELGSLELLSLRNEKESSDYNLISSHLEWRRPLLVNVLRIIEFILNTVS